jgi:hypothetical protein
MTVATSCFLPVRLLYGFIFTGCVHLCWTEKFQVRQPEMPVQQNSMARIPTHGSSSTGVASKTERRASRRCKITQLMRLRPSDHTKLQFEDLRSSLSVSRNGIFFQTSEPGYELGMRLFVTMPYSQNSGAASRDYLAEVVRKVELPNGLTGVGFKILMELSDTVAFPSDNFPNQQ